MALPLFSSLVILLPEEWSFFRSRPSTRFSAIASISLRVTILLIMLSQFFLFVRSDVQTYNDDLHRAENNQRIQFYMVVQEKLTPLPVEPYNIYYDYRLYVPETSGWKLHTTYDLLDYGYIKENKFDVLILLEQRIRDYLNPNVTGIDPELFALNQEFYQDAENGTISGYNLVYRDSLGLVYVSDDLYQQYYSK